MLEKLNKLSLPATILIGCVILGAFYFLAEVSKQGSIERQQRAELQAKADTEQTARNVEAMEKLDKLACVTEATEAAKSQYEDTCTYDCKDGYYYTANYDSYYKKCLQRKGLE
jgi:hypothetical protein